MQVAVVIWGLDLVPLYLYWQSAIIVMGGCVYT